LKTAVPETPHQIQDAARERGRAAADHLSRVNGAQGLQAAVLALLLPAGSRRAARAWQIETQATTGAQALREHIANLPPAARLPWLEVLLVRLRGQALATRQALLEATRRVMAARGTVRPIDRLHWLMMRQCLGQASAASAQAAAQSDLSHLPATDVLAVARYCAFLSRMVPVELHDDANATEVTATDAAASAAWYASAMARWEPHNNIPPCAPPDIDGLVQALQELQALAWMQRPVLARDWVTAALQHSRHGRLADAAADALRLSCALLESPLPPELERHYQSAAEALPS
jgi:hypothetical protein